MPFLLRSEEHTSELQSPCNLVCRFCLDRKSTRLNSSHLVISYAVFCLKKKNTVRLRPPCRRGHPGPARPRETGHQRRRAPSRPSFFFLMIRRPPRSTLFPYPPLFR